MGILFINREYYQTRGVKDEEEIQTYSNKHHFSCHTWNFGHTPYR